MKLNDDYPLIREIREAEEFRTPPELILKIMYFAILVCAVIVVESIAIGIGYYPKLIDWAIEEMSLIGSSLDTHTTMQKLRTLLLDPEYTHIMLFCTGCGTIVTFFYCRTIEGRSLSTMGLHKKGCFVQYLIGMVLGFILFGAVAMLSLAMGGLTWNGFQGGSLSRLLLVLAAFLVQGMSEEVVFRGCFMTSILRDYNIYWAVGLNSVAFSLVHFGNKGITALAAVNLALYAAMISLYVLRTNNLWGACAFHSIWNFAQGNFFGLPVSGINSGARVFSMSLAGDHTFLNGGEFGLEASISMTIVMIVALGLLLLIPQKKQPAREEKA